MRILVNGFLYGGNCPPFVANLKKLNPDTKIISVLGFLDEYGINRDYLKDEDIFHIRTNNLEKLLIYGLKKSGLPGWKNIFIRKARNILRDYEPSLVINHKAGIRAEIMLHTGFRPQVTYIYGSEVHGDKINNRGLKYVFRESRHVMVNTEQMKSYVLEAHQNIKHKIRTMHWGHYEMPEILERKGKVSRRDLQRKYNIHDEDIIFLDNRSLRGSHTGFDRIINAIRKLNGEHRHFKVLFLKGFLGTEPMVNKLRKTMTGDETVRNHVILMDRIVPQDTLMDLYFLSDAFISLLPDDQFGTSILDAVLTDCSLVLSDLEVYRYYLGADGPLYIKDQDENELVRALRAIIGNRSAGRIEKRYYKRVVAEFNPANTFRNIYRFCESIINDKNEAGIN